MSIKIKNFLSDLFAAIALFGGEEIAQAKAELPEGMEELKQGDSGAVGGVANSAGGAVPDKPAEDVANGP